MCAPDLSILWPKCVCGMELQEHTVPSLDCSRTQRLNGLDARGLDTQHCFLVIVLCNLIFLLLAHGIAFLVMMFFCRQMFQVRCGADPCLQESCRVCVQKGDCPKSSPCTDTKQSYFEFFSGIKNVSALIFIPAVSEDKIFLSLHKARCSVF